MLDLICPVLESVFSHSMDLCGGLWSNPPLGLWMVIGMLYPFRGPRLLLLYFCSLHLSLFPSPHLRFTPLDGLDSL